MSHAIEWFQRIKINDNFKLSFTTMNSKEAISNVQTSMSVHTVNPISAVAPTAKPQYYSK